MSKAAPEVGSKPGAPAATTQPPPVSPAGLVLPIVTSITLLLCAFVFVSHDAAAELLTQGVLIFTVLGKFAPLFPIESGFLRTPFHMALLVVYMDLLFSVIAVFNLGVLYRIPRFGKVLSDLKGLGGTVLSRNPWMRRATFAGVIAFVMFPLSGTGAIGGALFGELLGMAKRRILVGIAIGSLIGSFGMALLADWLRAQLGPEIKDSWVFKIGGIVALVGVVSWLTARYRKLGPVQNQPAESKSIEGADSGSGAPASQRGVE